MGLELMCTAMRHGLFATCLEKVLERGEIFDLMVDRTDKLHRSSVKFKGSATTLRKTVWRRNVKLWALLVFVGLVRKPCASLRWNWRDHF